MLSKVNLNATLIEYIDLRKGLGFIYRVSLIETGGLFT